MQGKFGNFWKNSSKAKKTLLIAIALCVILLLRLGISYFYFYGVQPLLAWVTSTDDNVHHGLEFYTGDEYKTYEHGEQFAQILSRLDYVSEGKVVDFYHCENEHFDNPVHGKQWDVFSVDVQLDTDNYAYYKKEIHENSAYCTYKGDFDLYLTDYGESYAELTAVCWNQNLIRVIFLPDYENIIQRVENKHIAWCFDTLNRYLEFDYQPLFDYDGFGKTRDRTGDGSLS